MESVDFIEIIIVTAMFVLILYGVGLYLERKMTEEDYQARVQRFREKHPDWSIVTGMERKMTEEDSRQQAELEAERLELTYQALDRMVDKGLIDEAIFFANELGIGYDDKWHN